MMLNTLLKNRHLILASGSPRRKSFLQDLGLKFEIRIKEVVESYPISLKGEEISEYLAKLKATPFLKELKKDDILITADTIVWLEGKALGKPKNKEEASVLASANKSKEKGKCVSKWKQKQRKGLKC